MQTRYLALGPRFGLVLVAQGRLSWLPGVAFWAILENEARFGRITKLQVVITTDGATCNTQSINQG